MSIKRLMRQTRTILAVPYVEVDGEVMLIGGTAAAPTLTPFTAPTSTCLNDWAKVQSAGDVNASIGGNISGATLDNMSLGLGTSATDSTLLIVSVGNEVSPTLNKVNSTFEFMRDLDQMADGSFNLAWLLARSADLGYVIVDRVQGGKKATDPFSINDLVSLYLVKTDNGIDNLGDQKYTTFGQTFIADGLVNPSYTLTA